MNVFENGMIDQFQLNREIKRALQESVPHLGGITVPEVVASAIMKLAQMEAQVTGLFPSVTMTSNVYHPNRIAAGSTAYKIPELGTITTSSFSFVRNSVYAKKFGAKIENISTELLEDSNTNIWAEVSPQLTKDIARLVDKEILEGTGGDGFTGLLNATGIQNVPVVGDNGDAITLQKILKAKSLLSRKGIRATHLIAPTQIVDDLELMEDSAGNLIMNTLNYGTPLLGENRIGRLKGLFIIETDQISEYTVGTSNDAVKAIVLAPTRAGLVGNKREMTLKRDENIDNDSWKAVMTYRKGFATQDPLAICTIDGLVPQT